MPRFTSLAGILDGGAEQVDVVVPIWVKRELDAARAPA